MVLNKKREEPKEGLGEGARTVGAKVGVAGPEDEAVVCKAATRRQKAQDTHYALKHRRWDQLDHLGSSPVRWISEHQPLDGKSRPVLFKATKFIQTYYSSNKKHFPMPFSWPRWPSHPCLSSSQLRQLPASTALSRQLWWMLWGLSPFPSSTWLPLRSLSWTWCVSDL